MSIDPKIFATLSTLSEKNPKNVQADWFVMGFLYANSGATKSIEDVFNAVNNITSLERSKTLGKNDTIDILIKMMNNSMKADKPSNGAAAHHLQASPQDLRMNGASSAQKDGANKTLLRKSSTIPEIIREIDHISDKTGLIDDMSYHSDKDLSPTKGKENNKKNGKLDDLLELDLLDENSGDKSKNGYVHKPIHQVNVSELFEPKNLKRPPPVEEDQLTLELIKKLQEEDEKIQREIEERKKKEEKEQNEVTCSICLGSLLDEAFLPLESCVHLFHENCFAEYLKSEINSRHFPIKCPSNCGTEVSEGDVVQVLDKDLITKFYEYSLQKYVSTHADEISCCPTPNCTYAFADDEKEGDADEHILNCPLCKKKYCLNCRVEYHKGMTCKEYQVSNTKDANDLKFEKFVKGKKFKQCSKCKFWVEKNQGCDHMTCRCKYEFCYKCGGKYRECECVKKMQELAQKRQEIARQRQQNARNKRKKR